MGGSIGRGNNNHPSAEANWNGVQEAKFLRRAGEKGPFPRPKKKSSKSETNKTSKHNNGDFNIKAKIYYTKN